MKMISGWGRMVGRCIVVALLAMQVGGVQAAEEPQTLAQLHHTSWKLADGALIEADALPRSAILAAQPLSVQRECGLSGGDDYELVFTAPVAAREAVQRAAQVSDTAGLAH